MPFTISALALVSRKDSTEKRPNPAANVLAVMPGYMNPPVALVSKTSCN
jgi:hypothetical protein